METVKTWALQNLTGSVGPIDMLQGTAGDGDVVTAVYSNDWTTAIVGGDGSTVFCDNPAKKLGEITFRLLQTSRVNAILQAAVTAAELAGVQFIIPILLKDPNGGTVIASPSCALKKVPDWKAGKEVQVREWTFLAADMVVV